MKKLTKSEIAVNPLSLIIITHVGRIEKLSEM